MEVLVLGIISINNLTKTYNGNRGIDNVSLEVKKGEIYGFIGPNGAGKSTTIKLLLNFIFPTMGEAKIFGLDVVKNSAKIKTNIGYVPSEVRFYEDMTALQLLKTTIAFQKRGSQEDIDKLCSIFEIDRNKKMSELSLGNKKKVAIATALVHSPELIILDEPTSGLDPLMQKRLFEVLKEKRENGATIFVSSHNLNEVQEHCTIAAFIKEGKIIEIQDLTKEFKKSKIFTVVSSNLDIEQIEKLGAVIIDNNEELIFTFDGKLNEMLEFLSKFDIQDIKIDNISLESKFLSYYEGGDK
jgi:ABC-2 type transport system ATP-binding protein